jgi:hypothetical protein
LRVASLVVAAVAAMIAACDGKPKDPPPDLLKSQRQTIDKAKAVGDVLQKSADERREQSERQ